MHWVDLLHRWTGGTIGLLLAILGLTGALLIHRRIWVLLPHVGDPQVQTTDRLAAITMKLMGNPTTRPDMLTFADRDFGLDRLVYKSGAGAYADQAGGIVTRWSSQWERPELWLFDLHHHFFLGDTGETVIGIAGLAGIGFVVTGTILWWRTRRTFTFRIWPKRMSRPAIVRHHRDLGIVVAPLLLLSFVTGTLMVFRPLTALAFGPGAPAAITRMSKPPAPLAVETSDHLDWAGIVRVARGRYPNAELRSIALPKRGSGLIVVRMKQPEEWLPSGRTMIWFAANDGRLVEARDATAAPRSAKAYNLLFPLHAAEVGGLAYRIVMTISGLALTLLGSLTVWTFWFKRPARITATPVSSKFDV